MKNEANPGNRNMDADEDLSQDSPEPGRKTNPKSRERGVIGSGVIRDAFESGKSHSARWSDRSRFTGHPAPLGWLGTVEQPFVYVRFILVRWPDGNQR